MAPETAVLETAVLEVAGGADVVDSAVEHELPLEVLERQLTSHAAHLAAAEARWLGWLGEYCIREGWGTWGCSGPVQWLSWQCGMSPSTAREKVRIALALRELPVIARRFGQGRLSYSKVRALTRIATPDSDYDLAELAVAATGSQLDTIVRARKRALDSNAGATDAWGQRRVTSRSIGENLTEIRILVPNDESDRALDAIAAEVSATIDDAKGETGLDRKAVTEARGGFAAMRADAAIALLTGDSLTVEAVPTEVQIVVDADSHDRHLALDQNAPAGAFDIPRANAEATSTGTAVQVGVDADSHDHHLALDQNAPAGAFTSRGRAIAPSVGARLCCDPRIAVLVEDSRGTVFGSGRETRLVNRKLRRALLRRDRGQCQFPGCRAHRRLHAHHIIHWNNGGPTELNNLILLCNLHHHVVHEGGWNVNPTDRSFLKPDGTTADPNPTARLHGNANQTTTAATFNRVASLAEAENQTYDLGLVLESLAWNRFGLDS